MESKINFDLGKVENIVGKGENAGYQHFILFPQCFRKVTFSGSLKVGIFGDGSNCLFLLKRLRWYLVIKRDKLLFFF